MLYYAIREKATGNLMPAATSRERRSSLVPRANCVPRLWSQARWAKSYLGNWCKGELIQESSYSYDGEYDVSLDYKPGTERDRSKYEVVPVRLTI